jgi:hypothetical protein
MYSDARRLCGGKEAYVRPEPHVWQESPIPDGRAARPESDGAQAGALVQLSEEQRRLIAVLQTEREGMTVRQLQTRLSWPRDGVQLHLEALLEQQVVARLNTLVPSYIYRFEGVYLDAD